VAIAALFDVDGTLIARNSAPLYMRHLRRTGQARRRDVARTLYFLLRYKLGMLDVDRALAVSMEWVRGKVEADIRDDCIAWYARDVRPHVYASIVTSATRYLAEPLGAELGISDLLVTQLVVRDGRFTGEPVRPVCYGAGKIHWVDRFAARYAVDLAQSYFYTDSITDLPLLERVGHPRVINPDPRLRRLAQRRGWPVRDLRLDETTAMPLAAAG